MCRLLAYTGPEISLHDLILKPQHSLEKQAWQPQELKEAKLNADGFGFGWYKENEQIARYRQPFPIWNDANLLDLSQTLKQSLLFAMVRSATVGLGASTDNTQPFAHKHWLFQHNGYIMDFDKNFRGQTRQLLNINYENIVKGNTDSEYIFALLMQQLNDINDPVKAIKQTLNILKDLVKDTRCLLNIMLSDGETIYASKHAINGECPSLYYGYDIKDFPTSSQLLVSEKLNDDSHWKSIDDNNIIVIKQNKTIELLPL